MWISQFQLQQFRSVTKNVKKPVVLLSLAIEGIKNKLVWKKYMSLVQENILLVIYGPVDVDLEANNIIFLTTNEIFKYYGWCDASLVYLLIDALKKIEYLDPEYVFVISGTCIPLQKTFDIKSQIPTFSKTQWIHMDNKSFKIILSITKDKEFLFETLREWSIHTSACPDELWFESNKDVFPGIKMEYTPSVMSFRSFETETSPFTFTSMHNETFLRLFTTVNNAEVNTFASIKTNLTNLVKIIGSRDSKPIYIGDAFYMKNKSIANLIIFKSLFVTTTGEFPDGLYKCIDVDENNKITSVFINTNEVYTFHIKEQKFKRYFFRKVDLDLNNQKILVNLLDEYCWNEYNGQVEPYEPIFETNSCATDSFANVVLLEMAKKYILESDVYRIKKYDEFPLIISSSFLKLEDHFKETYKIEAIDLFPLLSLPFNITRNGKPINIEHDGDWTDVYKKLRTETYEEFLESVKSLNIKLA